MSTGRSGTARPGPALFITNRSTTRYEGRSLMLQTYHAAAKI